MTFDKLSFLRRATPLLIMAFSSGCAKSQWFLTDSCSGTDLTISVAFDGERLFKAHGPACDEYESNIDGRWEKQKLSFEFEPDREITWEGYREHPFNSTANSVLRVDLWLAGAGANEDLRVWFVGVSVHGADTIYMNTLHIADLTGPPSSSCIAEDFCIHTSTD